MASEKRLLVAAPLADSFRPGTWRDTWAGLTHPVWPLEARASRRVFSVTSFPVRGLAVGTSVDEEEWSEMEELAELMEELRPRWSAPCQLRYGWVTGGAAAGAALALFRPAALPGWATRWEEKGCGVGSSLCTTPEKKRQGANSNQIFWLQKIH